MKIIVTKLIVPVLLLMSCNVFAATLIETDDAEGSQKMWIEGSKMRVQMDATGQYMLADFKRKKVYIVAPSKQELIDASDFVQQSKKNTRGLNVKVDYVGKGPTIAGYSTKKYNLSVNGQACEQALLSRQALKDARLEIMMENMGSIDLNVMGSQFMSVCDRAESLFARRMKNLGMPLGTIERDGRLRGKVKSIVKNAKLPAGGFNLPKGYRRVSMQQKMQDGFGGNMPSMPATEMTPEMKRMMEQMMKRQK